MIDLKKFIKAVELVNANGLNSMGLIVKSPTKKIGWSAISDRPKTVVKIDESKMTADEMIKKMAAAVKSGKWLILELTDNLPAKVYTQLKLIASSNRMQFLKNNEVVDLKLSDDARIVAIASFEALKNIQRNYPDFKRLFGPIIEIK
jgi:hypothetical protein